MIHNTDIHSRQNWRILKDKLIGGLQYSWKNSNPRTGAPHIVSIDENLGRMAVSQGSHFTAKEVIDVIGEEAFKALVANLCNPALVMQIVPYRYGTNLSVLTRSFRWSRTIEGSHYWSMVTDKLKGMIYLS